MTTIPDPIHYRSETLNELMRHLTPKNIDGVAASVKKLGEKAAPQDFIRRLSAQVNLEAIAVRRDQFVKCGALTQTGGEGE